MKSLTGLSLLVVLALTGCGGSDSGGSDTEPTKAPAKLELADACVKVQAAYDSAKGAEAGLIDTSQYSQFGNDVAALVEQADDRAVSILEELSDRSDDVATRMQTAVGADRLTAATDFLQTYKRMMDACEAVGSPIGLS